MQEERKVPALNEDTADDLNETMTEKRKFYLELLLLLRKI